MVSSEIEPLKLAAREKEGLKLLYLAKFAPYPGQPIPTKDPLFPALASYHFDLYRTLCDLSFIVTPMADLGAALLRLRDYGYVFSVQNSAPFRNSEVLISAAAECYGIPYLGAPPNVRALAEDKYLANAFARSIGIRTPQSALLQSQEEFDRDPPFPGPFILKSRFGVNSEMLTDDCVQDVWKDLRTPWERLSNAGLATVVETFIPGRNVGAPFVEALGSARTGFLQEAPVGGRNILTRDHKQNVMVFDQRTVFDEGPLAEELRAANASIRREIGPCDYFRTDWRVREGLDEPYFIELNICCSLARRGGVASVCSALGWSYEQTIETIIATSIRREPSPR